MQGKLFRRCTHLLYCSVLSLGGNDEASSLHLNVPIDGLLVYEEEEQQLHVVVQLVHMLASLTVYRNWIYPQLFCGLFVSLWPFFMIMSGDRVDAMDSDSSRDGWHAMQSSSRPTFTPTLHMISLSCRGRFQKRWCRARRPTSANSANLLSMTGSCFVKADQGVLESSSQRSLLAGTRSCFVHMGSNRTSHVLFHSEFSLPWLCALIFGECIECCDGGRPRVDLVGFSLGTSFQFPRARGSLG